MYKSIWQDGRLVLGEHLHSDCSVPLRTGPQHPFESTDHTEEGETRTGSSADQSHLHSLTEGALSKAQQEINDLLTKRLPADVLSYLKSPALPLS